MSEKKHMERHRDINYNDKTTWLIYKQYTHSSGTHKMTLLNDFEHKVQRKRKSTKDRRMNFLNHFILKNQTTCFWFKFLSLFSHISFRPRALVAHATMNYNLYHHDMTMINCKFALLVHLQYIMLVHWIYFRNKTTHKILLFTHSFPSFPFFYSSQSFFGFNFLYHSFLVSPTMHTIQISYDNI